jgi:hypothetical protein
MKKALQALTVCATLASAGHAWATPSTTVWAPSTTYTQPFLVPHLSYDTYFRNNGDLPTTAGLTMGVIPSETLQGELGFDLLYPGNDPLFLNGKVTLVEDKLFANQPALSLGIANAGITTATNWAMAYALVGKTIPGVGGSVAVGGYYGLDDKLWRDPNGKKDRAGLLASIASPTIKIGQPFLDSIVLAADVQTGSNAFSAAGAAASFYFTPSIALLTGPVFFLEKNAPGAAGTDFMWTMQIDVDLPLKK